MSSILAKVGHRFRGRGCQKRNFAVMVVRMAVLIAVLAVGSMAMGRTAVAAETADDRLQRITESSKLRVCIWPQYFAISYYNPKSGDLAGIDIDMARALASDLGVAVQFVDSSFATFIDDLLTDKCDVAMFGIGITKARAEKVEFSQPHLRSDIYAIAPKNHPSIKVWNDIDKAGNVVVAQKGTYMEPVMKAYLKAAKLAVVNRPNEREEEVVSGRADVFMTDYPYGQRVMKNVDWARLIEPSEPVSPTDYGYALAPGQPAWRARVNRFIDEARADGRLAAFAQSNGLTPIAILSK
ncbi:MAG: ABC transporter substrate-binding protein [Rhodospirillales bacterium]